MIDVQKVAPCADCIHLIKYITSGRNMKMCGLGKAKEPGCLWFVRRPYYRKGDANDTL